LKNPPIVLLDEATSALDTITEESVQHALNTLGQNRTVIIIAHRLSTIRRADQIIVLDGGSIAEIGSHEELLSKNGMYASLWNRQFTSHDEENITNDLKNN
jgi:ATP-binding cassette subfamily B protein